MLANLQLYVFIALAVVTFALELFALVDALRRPARAFVAEGKLTKTKWTVILGVATAFGLLALPTTSAALNPLGFLSILGAVAAIVYLVDVRPRLQPHGTGRGRPQRPSGW